MARRRRRHVSNEDNAIVGLIVLVLIVGSTGWHWLRSFPGPIALLILTGSAMYYQTT